MLENLDLNTVNWARAQFALTAMYHWLFVPLTLGLSWIIAFFHTIYVKTGNDEWRRLTRFWMKLFAINFAIGVASGIVLEFEFGTNWSNYSWMVGDIFGAPLAIEGIIAFFLEATFFAVMFFGWNRVSKRFHLFSTWMVALGSNLSAVWILVANAWMQHPVGQAFNPDTMRFEMQNFAEVAFSPFAICKFTHTATSSLLTAALFVLAVSSWFLLRNRHQALAKRSIIVAAALGFAASLLTVFNGDESGHEIAQVQPMKLAAIEGLYLGEQKAGLVLFGLVNGKKRVGDTQEGMHAQIKIPWALSLMANRSLNTYVPGMYDLVYGNLRKNIQGAEEKMKLGREAIAHLEAYRKARKSGDLEAAQANLAAFQKNKAFLGYAYLNDPEEAAPPVALSFYSFHIMVFLGLLFPLVFLLYLYRVKKGTLERSKRLLSFGCFLYFLGIIAGQAGWIVAEVGRQPWAIQDLLPLSAACTKLGAGTVQFTFFLFLALFTALLLAEISIMLKQISLGPEEN